jgi:ABC-type glucose/galactose transport system permease subunit
MTSQNLIVYAANCMDMLWTCWELTITSANKKMNAISCNNIAIKVAEHLNRYILYILSCF